MMKMVDTPVLDQLLDPVGELLTPEVARKLANLKFGSKSQARIKSLARKCNEGKLSTQERREYESYVNTMDVIAILQAKARSIMRQ